MTDPYGRGMEQLPQLNHEAMPKKFQTPKFQTHTAFYSIFYHFPPVGIYPVKFKFNLCQQALLLYIISQD